MAIAPSDPAASHADRVSSRETARPPASVLAADGRSFEMS